MMTFDSRETSVQSGNPVELYDFSRSYLHWRYTSRQADLSLNGVLYSAVPISRSAVEMSNEINRSTLRVTVQRDNPVAEMWRVSPPSDPITLTLSEVHEDDWSVAVFWLGRIINVEWSESLATIVVDPNYSSVRRQGLRRKYSRSCTHVLFGPGCRLNETLFSSSVIVGSISGLTISANDFNAHGDHYYSGGYVAYEVEPDVYDYRYIASQVGAIVTLTALPHNLEVGQTVKVFPGCDHTIATCSAKFSNTLNYGGEPYIPTKNPFTSSSSAY